MSMIVLKSAFQVDKVPKLIKCCLAAFKPATKIFFFRRLPIFAAKKIFSKGLLKKVF